MVYPMEEHLLPITKHFIETLDLNRLQIDIRVT